MKIMHKPTLKRARALSYNDKGESSITNNLEKIYNEIEIWAQINNKNAITLHEIIDDYSSDNLYLIMEYADLGQLADWDT